MARAAAVRWSSWKLRDNLGEPVHRPKDRPARVDHAVKLGSFARQVAALAGRQGAAFDVAQRDVLKDAQKTG